MAIVAVSIAPLGTGSTSVSTYVAETQRVLERHPNLRFRLDPMFTTIEGDLPEIFQAIQEMHEALVAMGAKRLSTVVKIDDRRDVSHSMEEKVAAVEEKTRR
ncbi:MTH1187 family thiamine-binding protein [Alicyclobacillus macrosporangiidus]|uniref:MTH1187 family thiamine-binding protein n=1 Tax=Alicyclobacillus macrosporangiidus TaxID=392015 RepID=UPI0004962C20|nr:MTH1187 family thiamine-binding protein [Alicyclobacillus macrosporangiidus]MCL6599386.1 MTH1187 family thiamine-binding protein [Alicyclobacillus macrosporangiidus]